MKGQKMGVDHNIHGDPLLPDAPPPPREMPQPGDWTPFDSKVQFELADLLYHCTEVLASNINALLEIWAQSVHDFDASLLFKNHADMHATIDSSVLGDVPCQYMVTQVPTMSMSTHQSGCGIVMRFGTMILKLWYQTC